MRSEGVRSEGGSGEGEGREFCILGGVHVRTYVQCTSPLSPLSSSEKLTSDTNVIVAVLSLRDTEAGERPVITGGLSLASVMNTTTGTCAV